VADWRQAEAAWYDETGLALGSPDEATALRAAETITRSWAVDEEYGNPARIALEAHCGLVRGAVADALIADAMRRISTRPTQTWIGPDRRVIESGYALLAPLMAADDYDTSLAVYQFLHTGISGGEPLSDVQQWFSMWATSRGVRTESDQERHVWQAFRDAGTSRRLTHVTQDTYRALSRIASRCPHPDIRESALADIAGYEALVEDFKQRGVYLQFS
jgi:hypothetical protein